jgi:hypothetical protein
MIELNAEEARTLVSSYAFLMELSVEHEFDLRPEEFRLYDKVNGALEIEVNRAQVGLPPEAAKVVNDPPPDPHREEDAYAPNVSE